ncbi:hypothetical protein, partial [Escherichia coli]|uniref:hypothetical protein n=1 Tax=Escherichia coli TaxID=562 RepID=UPI003D059D97
RKELRRIISARFELLEQELATRRNAIRNRMETEMRQQKAKDIATYEAKIKELTKDAEKLNAKAEALVTEYKAHGLTGT